MKSFESMRKTKIIKLLSNNILFIMLFIGIFICVWKKDTFLSMPIVSHPDSQIELSAEQNTLKQTWLSNVKEISAITIYITPTTNFQGEMKLQLAGEKGLPILADTTTVCNFIEGESQNILFEFTNLSVEQGKQYQIILSYTGDGNLLVDSGSDYWGCSIDNEEIGQAAAFNIVFVKNSRLFWAFASFFPLLGFALLFMIIFERKWEETVGISLLVSMLTLYLFGLFGKLEMGIYAVYILASISIAGALIIYNKKKMTARNILSPGLIVYGVLLVLILINCNNAFLARWDEYSHWGLAAKDMFYFDSFSKHVETTVVITRYPPFSTLVEYFFCYANKFFSQSILYVGYQTTLLSMLIVICKVANKQVKYLWIALIGIVGIPTIFFNDAYNSIYADCMLAILVAYVLFCYFSEESSYFNWMRITGGIFAIVLTKETGVVLSSVLAIIILADIIIMKYRGKKWDKKELAISIFMMVFLAVVFASWQLYLQFPLQGEEVKTVVNFEEDSVITDQKMPEDAEIRSYSNAISASGISLEGILNLLTGRGEDYQYKVIKNYIKAIFSDNIYQFGIVSFSYIDLFVVLVALAVIMSSMHVMQDEEKKISALATLSFVVGMLYVLFLLVAYLFAFSEREAIILHSYSRYLSTYLCGVVIALFGTFLVEASQVNIKCNQGQIWRISLCIIAVLVCAIPFEAFVIKNMDTQITADVVYGQDDIAEKIRSFTKPGDSIYFVCNNSEGHSYHIFRNTASPVLIANDNWNLYETKEKYRIQEDLNKVMGVESKGTPFYITPSEWTIELQGVDYVFLLHVDDMFKNSYKELFINDKEIKDASFYRVIEEDSMLYLEYVGSVGIKKWK